MNFSGTDVKLTSFPVGETGTNVTAVTFGHRSGKLLATGSEDNTIHIYVIGQMTSLLTSQCQTSAITALRFSNEENLLASGSRSGAIKICDLPSQKVIHPGGHKTCIRSIEYFPSSNNFLATAAVDGTAKLWDPRRQGFLFNYKGHNGAINALKFSPDGRYLITASDDTAIRMWDITAGKVLKAFQEHQGPVNTIEYHPKELLLASGGSDRRIKFWDLEKLQFICETDIETSAIKCLAFEPTNASYILSGSNDMLRAYNWEPVQLLDTVQMNWKNVLDMTIHKDHLYGASAVLNKVFLGSVQLSNLKTKRRISPVRDYFPSDPKASLLPTNATSTRRSHYQPTTVKDEHVKLQPDSSNTSNSDEPKPSVADSVMIDNQADYDEIFRGRSRLPRSPSHQGVSTSPTAPPLPPPPLSGPSSAGFIVQTPLPTEVPSVKPKSPPPQVDKLMPPMQMPSSSEQPRTNEKIFASLSKANQTVENTQNQRSRNLNILRNQSRNSNPHAIFRAIICSQDPSFECFLLRFINEKLSKRDWNLELCTIILPGVRDLIKSHYHGYNLIACDTLGKILTDFGKMIYDNVAAKSIGVDLCQQERRDKCNTCHGTLYDIRCILEERLKTVADLSLKRAFDDNLRLLYSYERS